VGGVERERGDEGACVRAVFFLIFLFSFFLTFGCAWTAGLTPWRESESEREKAREPVKGQNIKQKHHPLSPPLLTSPLSIFFFFSLHVSHFSLIRSHDAIASVVLMFMAASSVAR